MTHDAVIYVVTLLSRKFCGITPLSN